MTRASPGQANFSKANKKMDTSLKAVNPNHSYIHCKNLAESVITTLDCKLATEHCFRGLVTAFGATPKNDSLICGLEEFRDDLDRFEFEQQFQMITCVEHTDLTIIGTAKLSCEPVWDKYTEKWKTFGYTDSDDESENDSLSEEAEPAHAITHKLKPKK